MSSVVLDFNMTRTARTRAPNRGNRIPENRMLKERPGYNELPISGVRELRGHVRSGANQRELVIQDVDREFLEGFYIIQGIRGMSISEKLWKGLAGQLKLKRDNLSRPNTDLGQGNYGEVITFRNPEATLREYWLDHVGAQPHIEIIEDTVHVRSEETYKDILDAAIKRLERCDDFTVYDLKKAEHALMVQFYTWLDAHGLIKYTEAMEIEKRGQRAMANKARELIGTYSTLTKGQRDGQNRWIAEKTGHGAITIQNFVNVLDQIKDRRPAAEARNAVYEGHEPEPEPIIPQVLTEGPICNIIESLIPKHFAPEPAPAAQEADMPKSFAERVYDVVRRIPKGQVATYKQIAEALDMNRGYQAIGQALKRNTDPTVACHRVVKSSGKLGGYRGGQTATKAEILRSESVEFTGDEIDLGKYRCEL